MTDHYPPDDNEPQWLYGETTYQQSVPLPLLFPSPPPRKKRRTVLLVLLIVLLALLVAFIIASFILTGV